MSAFKPTSIIKGIYSSLNENAAISALVEGVYSHIPEHTNYPYIHIHVDEIHANPAVNISSCEAHCQITTFSQTNSPAELYSITELAHDALINMGNDDFDGLNLINASLINADFNMLKDGRTHVSRLLLRFIFEEE